jgi:hypothetical protein
MRPKLFRAPVKNISWVNPLIPVRYYAGGGEANHSKVELQSAAENLESRVLSGVLAQLVERLNGIEEVTGSNPVGSIYICCWFCLSQPRRGNRRVTFPTECTQLGSAILPA